MAKYCAKCGAELRDTATFCDSCGQKCLAAESPAPAYTESQVQYAPPVTNPVTSSEKKSKKGLLIAIISVVLVVAIVLITIFVILPKPDKKEDLPEKTIPPATTKDYSVAGKDFVAYQNSFGTFYTSGIGTYNTNVSSNLTGNILLTNTSVSVDNSIYLVDRNKSDNNSYIAKLTYTSEQEIIEEIWLSHEELVNQLDESTAEAIIEASSSWQYYDGYIYLTITPSSEHFATGLYMNPAYKIIRININNKLAEIVGENYSANTFVIHDGWIYFSEIGYAPEETDIPDFPLLAYEGDNIGIYKMKTDGSNKTKLLAFDLEINYKNIEYSRDYKMYGSDIYSELSIYNDKLYYNYNADPFNSVLNRMSLDGSNVEKVALNSTYNYTFDANSNSLYYVTGSYYQTHADVKDIYKVDLDSLNEEIFANYSIGSDRIILSCIDSKLYICSYNRGFNIPYSQNYMGTENTPSFRGIYYDLKSKKTTSVYQYAVWEEKTPESLPNGIIINQGEKTLVEEKFFWADYDSSDNLFTFFN